MTFENLSETDRKLVLKVLYEIDFLLQRTPFSNSEYSQFAFDVTTCKEIYRDTLNNLLSLRNNSDDLKQIKQLLK